MFSSCRNHSKHWDTGVNGVVVVEREEDMEGEDVDDDGEVEIGVAERMGSIRDNRSRAKRRSE